MGVNGALELRALWWRRRRRARPGALLFVLWPSHKASGLRVPPDTEGAPHSPCLAAGVDELGSSLRSAARSGRRSVRPSDEEPVSRVRRGKESWDKKRKRQKEFFFQLGKLL